MKRLFSVSQQGVRALTGGNPFAEAVHDPTRRPYVQEKYSSAFKRACENPEEYWDEQAQRIVWFKKYDQVLDFSKPPFTKWFVGGETNNCYNALDRHVESGLGEMKAIIYDSPITNFKQTYSYKVVTEWVQQLSGVLRDAGVGPGDRVLIYMPMIPETLVAMLASTRLGAVHVVVFGGFAAKELSVRINHCQPKVIISASAGVEPNRVVDYKPMLDQAIEFSDWKPKHCVIYNRKHVQCEKPMKMKKDRDWDWDAAMAKSKPMLDCVSLPSEAPLYIIHTSGTTGMPKGVVRPNAGHAVVLPWTMQYVYNMQPGEVWWAASDFGWVVGHSYICYAPLLYGATAVLYEGKPVGTPDASQFFRVVAEHDVASFFCAPTAIRAIHQHDPHRLQSLHIRMKKLRAIFSAGEHLDMEARQWAEHKFQVPVLDHWWQTESGSPITAPCSGCPDANFNPLKDSSGQPVPGWDVRVLKEDGTEAARGELGRIVVKMPLSPVATSTFWQNDERFSKTYFETFPGYYDTQDAGLIMPDGSVSVMSRVDDVINVAGHRLSSGALEEAILHHPMVSDCAVVGVDDKLKGAVPLAVLVLSQEFHGTEESLRKDVVSLVNREIGHVASLRNIAVVSKLPRTRAGKIARNTMAAIANGKHYTIPVTIEDASVYPEVETKIRKACSGG